MLKDLKSIVEAAESGKFDAVCIDHRLWVALAKAKGIKPEQGMSVGKCRIVASFYLAPGSKGEV